MTERDAFRGPGAWNVDFIVGKRFRFGTSKAALVRLEAYNLFNHHNMYVRSDAADISSSTSITGFLDNEPQNAARVQVRILEHEGHEPQGTETQRRRGTEAREHEGERPRSPFVFQCAHSVRATCVCDHLAVSRRVISFIAILIVGVLAAPGDWSRPVRFVRRGPRHPGAACRRPAGASSRPPHRRGFERGVVVVDCRSRSRHPAASSTGRRRHPRQLAAVRHLLYRPPARAGRFASAAGNGSHRDRFGADPGVDCRPGRRSRGRPPAAGPGRTAPVCANGVPAEGVQVRRGRGPRPSRTTPSGRSGARRRRAGRLCPHARADPAASRRQRAVRTALQAVSRSRVVARHVPCSRVRARADLREYWRMARSNRRGFREWPSSDPGSTSPTKLPGTTSSRNRPSSRSPLSTRLLRLGLDQFRRGGSRSPPSISVRASTII